MTTLDTTTLDPPAAGTPPPGPATVLRGRALGRFLGQLVRNHDQLAALSFLPSGSGLVTIPAPGTHVVIVRHPAHARHLLVSNQQTFVKGLDYKILAVLLGKGLLTNDDHEDWQQQRARVLPRFARRHLTPMGTHMTDAAGDWLDRLDRDHRDGDELDLSAAMMGLTLDVVGRALFGANISEQDTRAVGRAMTTVLDGAGASFNMVGVYRVLSKIRGVEFEDLLQIRVRHWRRAMKAIPVLDDVVDRLIDAKVAAGSEGDDLLALLLQARDEQGGGAMPRQQVRDEVMTFLGAGHETTANAMSWMWMLLSQFPEARVRMEAEVDEVLQGRRPTFADLAQLPWTNAVFHEAMRLHPPVPAFSRVAAADDVVDGTRIRKGSVLLVMPYLIHRDPELWPNPEGFDPERFMPGAGSGRHKQAFMPFGGGRHICVGQGFALMEGVLLAAMTVQRFRFDLLRGSKIEREVAITARPRGGMPVQLRRRTGAPAVE
ncbi:MAG: cytochrome P450, partial [Solirubrobacteraceae bacterium]